MALVPKTPLGQMPANPYQNRGGLASLLFGEDSDAAKWTGSNSNTLLSLGSALLSGGPRLDFSGVASGAAQDDRRRAAGAEWEQQAKTDNQTKAYLRQKFPDLADQVDAGLPVSEAWNEVFRRQQGGPAIKPMEINGQLVDPTTGKVLGDYRDPAAGPASPSGYRASADGGLEFIPGGPADPSTQAKTTEAQRRNQQLASVIAPELTTVETNWKALTDLGNQTTLGVASPEYQQASNALGTIAQSYLYSVSGAAAPAEEVRKIVDSVTPKIGESKASADQKLRRVKQMAQAVIDAGGGVAPVATSNSGNGWKVLGVE